ncbi:hypothetical protein ASPSYDRAFT_405179 [Aspergillus sydowii CBS 593.65]|uniref:Secreted protein n=1 Tax=Aspergillus sydowii CBS 593.65 TaxID=1036612 RepID=A0A1L9T9Q6_9EURO|nr:uncharacterized protein ASPSYDRAFT_405179 [Aspergillus sydowii CBS 593.65]OJJ56146.1 hypothetical protein ASPSYDRAFT_405179 [Aspergillus sydowii CBS 593.65]
MCILPLLLPWLVVLPPTEMEGAVHSISLGRKNNRPGSIAPSVSGASYLFLRSQVKALGMFRWAHKIPRFGG